MAREVQVVPEGLGAALVAFLVNYPTTPERIRAVRTAIEGPAGGLWRKRLGNWAAALVPVEDLVPDAYRDWRPLVRDALRFVFSRLSPGRLAPRIVAQIEAPAEMPAEQRLLLLVARAPGLQKIGQIVARNRNFQPRFRRALAELENGISEVSGAEIQALILAELGSRVATYGVEIEPAIFSEASVSAVVRFTWRNPDSSRRERGVFKVMKPHIPGCFAEDMRLLERLAAFLAHKYAGGHSRFAALSKTFAEVRLLLAHEVDFPREQRVLPEAGRVYGGAPGVRVPRCIALLSTDIITALSRENGMKVTAALRAGDAGRTRLAERLVETLLGVPALATQEKAIFHGDPHAGNLLYDRERDDLVILDWALAERLNRSERRCLAVLILMTILRDADGIRGAVDRLRRHSAAGERSQRRAVRACVNAFLAGLPPGRMPGALDAMGVLGDAAQRGVRFPAPLLLFRKAVFTLQGVAEDVAGAGVSMGTVLGRYALHHLPAACAAAWSLLSLGDLLALEWSALTFIPRLCVQALDPPREG